MDKEGAGERNTLAGGPLQHMHAKDKTSCRMTSDGGERPPLRSVAARRILSPAWSALRSFFFSFFPFGAQGSVSIAEEATADFAFNG